jgi:thymidylate synthase ThyX
MYEAKVLADSISPEGIRLLTVQATFPRFILAEFNTHRVFSRNSASSRAIPTEKLLERVDNEPFIPEAFHKRIKGMGQGEALEDQFGARVIWLGAKAHAMEAAQSLLEMGVAKSIVNRLLEPFMWHTVIVSATSWDNFFALRAPVGDEVDYDFPAQPEIQKIAIMMRQVMRQSHPSVIHNPLGDNHPLLEPQTLAPGEAWHLPLVSPVEIDHHREDERYWPMVSAGRCARVSYDTHENYESPDASFERAERLLASGHMSPFEHVARVACFTHDGQANFNGWQQLRSEFSNEENFALVEGRDPWEVSISDASDIVEV